MAYKTKIAIWKTDTKWRWGGSAQAGTIKSLQMADYVHKIREDASLEEV